LILWSSLHNKPVLEAPVSTDLHWNVHTLSTKPLYSASIEYSV